jgi:hypothetical protein
MRKELNWKIGVKADGLHYWLTIDGLKQGDGALPIMFKDLPEAVKIGSRWHSVNLIDAATVAVWLVRDGYPDLMVCEWKS